RCNQRSPELSQGPRARKRERRCRSGLAQPRPRHVRFPAQSGGMPSGGFLAELCHWRTSADDRLLFGQPPFAEAFEHVVEIRPKLIGLEFFPHPESERGLHSKSLGNGQLRLGDAIHLSIAGSQIALDAWWPCGRALERDGRFRIAAEAIK